MSNGLLLPHPHHTIIVMQAICDNHIDAAHRLSATIEDLEADLRDSKNGWAEQSAIIKLTAARDEQAEHISKAATILHTVETLRRNAGMEATALGRVIAEYNK